MAATALADRELVAAKLEESVRQLRRYITSGGKSKRILEKRCKNVESEKDELLEIHHRYAEKSGTPVDDEAMKEFINPKLDAAEDALNEAIDVLDDLGEDDLKENMKTEAAKNNREAAMNEEILRYMIDEVSKILVVDVPTPDDVIKVEIFLVDIEKKEALLEMSFGALRGLVEQEAAEEYSKKEISLKRLISNTYAKMKWFIKKNTKVEGDLKNDEAVSDVRSTMRASLRLEKIKPPRFGGEIRNFARFKADFEAIVKPAYTDEMHLNYVLKESCLSGVAYELVRNVESVDEIWERLEERYGDAIEIVDSVIRDLQGVTINKFSQDRGMVQLVDILEKGVRDLTAIDKRKEIANAYTVKLLEQKFPRRVMMKWLDAKDKNGETDRFEALFMFLKQERRCLEKLIQQGGEGEKGTGVKDNAERRKVVNSLTDRRISDGQKSYSRCLIHENSNHLTRKCKLFLDKSVRERDKLVKERKACSLCLSSSHIGSPCPWMEKWNPCDVNGCGEYHSRLLHDNHYLKPNCRATSDGDRGTLLLVQKVKGEKNDVIIFWDSGSSISLVKKDYAYRCKLSGINVSYELVTLGNVPKLQNTVLFDVPIFDSEGKKHVIRAYAIEEICSGEEGVDVRDVVGEFTNLRPNEVQRRNNDVDLLVGMDYAHLQPEPIERRENLVLYSSRFGTGKLLGGQHNLIRGGNEVNLFAKTVAHARSVKIEVLKPRTEVDFFTAKSLGVNVLTNGSKEPNHQVEVAVHADVLEEENLKDILRKTSTTEKMIHDSQENTIRLQNIVSTLEKEKMNLENEIGELRHKIEDLQFQLEEQMMISGEMSKRPEGESGKVQELELKLASKEVKTCKFQTEVQELHTQQEEYVFMLTEKDLQLQSKDEAISRFEMLLNLSKENESKPTVDASELKEKLEEIKKLEEKINNLEFQNNELKAEYENNLTEKEASIFSLEEQLMGVENKLSSLCGEIVSKTTVITDLQHQIGKKATELEKHQTSEGELNTKINKLNEQLDTKQVDLTSTTAANEVLQNENLDLKASLEVLETRTKQLTEDNQKLEENILPSSKDSGDSAQQLTHLDEQLRCRSKEMNMLREQEIVLTAENNKLLQQLEDFKDKLEKETATLQIEKNDEIKKLEETLSKVEENTKQLKGLNYEIENKAHQLEMELQQSNIEMAVLTESNRSKEEKLRKVSSELEDVRQEVATLKHVQEELQKATNEVAQLTLSNREKDDRLSDLSLQLEAMKQQALTINNEIQLTTESTQKELHDRNNYVQELRLENENLRTNNESLTQSKDTICEQLENLQNEKLCLTEKLNAIQEGKHKLLKEKDNVSSKHEDIKEKSHQIHKEKEQLENEKINLEKQKEDVENKCAMLSEELKASITRTKQHEEEKRFIKKKRANEKVFRTVERSRHGVALIVPIEEQNDLVHHQRKIATVKNK